MSTNANPTPGTVTPTAANIAMQKAAALQAVTQLDIVISMFQAAPDRVKKAAVEFRDALKEWAESA